MHEEQERAAFEAWFASNYGRPTRSGDLNDLGKWISWKARAAVAETAVEPSELFLSDLRRKLAALPWREFEAAPGVYTRYVHQGAMLDAFDADRASLAKPQPVGGALTDALCALSHQLDDEAQGITDRTAYDFATRIRVLIGIDGNEAAQEAIATLSAPVAQPGEAVTLRAALEFAEDVMSRTPFSNAPVWGNGMHPNTGIGIIRDALATPIAAQPAAAEAVPVAEVAAGKYGNRLMWHFDGAQEATPVGTMLYAAPAQAAAVPKWRCFHCDEAFSDEDAAREHFGWSEYQQPACQIDIAEYRKLEEVNRRHCDEDTDLHRQIHGLIADHQTALQREEEKGYARGLRDGMKEQAAAVPEASEPAFITAMIDARRQRYALDQSCTPEFLHWLDTMTPREGVGANEAWNAGVEWQKAQAAAVPEAVERCECGYPMPCSKTVPINFCKAGLAAPEAGAGGGKP